MLLAAGDPFWVMVREAILLQAERTGAQLVTLEEDMSALPDDERLALVEELLAQDVDVLILQGADNKLAQPVLDACVPLVIATESEVRHPLATSPLGLYDAARLGMTYLVERIGRVGRLLLVGGLHEGYDVGLSRLRACWDVLRSTPQVQVTHIPTPWPYAPALEAVHRGLAEHSHPFDAVFGLSDSLALAGRDAAAGRGLMSPHTLVVGLNGDPLALAAILEGTMTATVETSASALGEKLVYLACQAARDHPLPPYFHYETQLVDRTNVTAVAAAKLLSAASIPSRLVGYSRSQEAKRLQQLETSLTIGRSVASVLDRRQLRHHIAQVIRANYAYDRVILYLWRPDDRVLVREMTEAGEGADERVPLAEAGLLGQALAAGSALFVPDTRRSTRFPPDPRAADCRSRVIVPIRFGNEILGLLDLHSAQTIEHSHLDLVGLQVVADQLGLAMRNAELYGAVLAAHEEAEQAAQLKSRLLANVGQELCLPLEGILDRLHSVLRPSVLSATDLPPALVSELRQAYQNAEHLRRLISDLLDLARAENDKLTISTELVASKPLLEQAFQTMLDSVIPAPKVEWRLELPEELPDIRCDPVRLRQILFNLLSNAHKFTEQGHITLGALASATHLHIWVEDTGCGIPLKQQQNLFRAFITSEHPRRPAEGLGLGLSVTHELVQLHGGTIGFNSLPGAGTTFHIYLPLPSPGSGGQPPAAVFPHVLPSVDELPPGANELTRQAVSYLRLNFAVQPLSRRKIAAHLAVSESYLTRVFHRDLGITPWEYLTRLRIERAKELLVSTHLTVTAIANEVGYNDGAYFSRVFRQETGRSPLDFRQQVRLHRL